MSYKTGGRAGGSNEKDTGTRKQEEGAQPGVTLQGV